MVVEQVDHVHLGAVCESNVHGVDLPEVVGTGTFEPRRHTPLARCGADEPVALERSLDGRLRRRTATLAHELCADSPRAPVRVVGPQSADLLLQGAGDSDGRGFGTARAIAQPFDAVALPAPAPLIELLTRDIKALACLGHGDAQHGRGENDLQPALLHCHRFPAHAHLPDRLEAA